MYFPKGYLPSGNFPRVFSQMAIFPTVQYLPGQLLKTVLTAELGPLACSSRSARPKFHTSAS